MQREVAILEEADLVRSTPFATAKVVRPNKESPYWTEVSGLALKSLGPAMLVADVLADEPGVSDAYIFGSWAARYSGEPGPDPGDVDVFIHGGRCRPRERRGACHRHRRHTRPRGEPGFCEHVGLAGTAPFLRTLRARPLYRLRADVE